MSSARRRFPTPSITLMHFVAGQTFGAVHVVPFRFAAPGPRVMLSLKILWRQIQDQSSTKVPGPISSPPNVNGIFDATFSNSVNWNLWLARTVIDRGGSGLRVPVQNILGTRTAPVRLLDGAVAQDGVSFDVVSGGDGVDGELTCDATPGGFEPDPALEVAIQGRYNAVQPLCDAEWASILSPCKGSPDATGQVFLS